MTHHLQPDHVVTVPVECAPLLVCRHSDEIPFIFGWVGRELTPAEETEVIFMLAAEVLQNAATGSQVHYLDENGNRIPSTPEEELDTRISVFNDLQKIDLNDTEFSSLGWSEENGGVVLSSGVTVIDGESGLQVVTHSCRLMWPSVETAILTQAAELEPGTYSVECDLAESHTAEPRNITFLALGGS